jgi:hypothetical protein
MKILKPVWLLSMIIILSGCRSGTDCNQILEDMQVNLEFGNLRATIELSDSLKKYCSDNTEAYLIADSLSQIAERIGLDFPVTEAEVIKQIEKRNGPFTPDEKSGWEKKGWLEWRMINGEKMYFSRAASNLMLLRLFYEQKEKRQQEIDTDPEMIFRLKHTEEAYKESENKGIPVTPVKMKIKYTITVHPDAVPSGELIRCWLPWPREGHLRQKNIQLVNTSNQEFTIAPDSAIHSTLYMEGVSQKGKPSIFQISYTYDSYAQFFNMSSMKILPYNKESEIYKKYTSEQLPHICFTENVRRLADSITGPDDNPAEIVRKIYLWFKENIPWAGALEYSIIPDIPEYVIKNRRGDCGMQTFLFMSMLRYKGIPVRWQSGWKVPPEARNLHDWCEVFYEGKGWVPADVSYDLQKSEIPSVREFYLSGIDAYRLIVNDGVAGPLHPSKVFMRSEPYDFQRGEVEWSRGNLYFDKWDYEMKIEYVQ